MKVLKEKQTWGAALEAMQGGLFANHSVWGAHSPAGAPDFIGPTALGLVKRKNVKGMSMVVFTDTGVEIHDWKPTADEMLSKDWQIVDLEIRPPAEPEEPAPALEAAP